jgi:hypothetical protein
MDNFFPLPSAFYKTPRAGLLPATGLPELAKPGRPFFIYDYQMHASASIRPAPLWGKGCRALVCAVVLTRPGRAGVHHDQHDRKDFK